MKEQMIEMATLGGGCFWCTEAVFQEIKGVIKVAPGYSGGTVPGTPTYKEVCSGLTGHAEVIQITFDASVVVYKEILEIFMTTHDPTTLNKQGGDVGTQYRSVIFYHDETQKQIAQEVLQNLSKYIDTPIVTQLIAFEKFYQAEANHLNYYKNNQTQSYCSFVISPKIAKLRRMHADKLK